MNVIGQAHSLIHDAGVQRVHTDVRVETRLVALPETSRFPFDAGLTS